ncbi:hypothetical protein A674_03690 [Salmonella enterica subsp. enterica serovar Enteritidis str. 2009K1651]|uniref:Uncharacterized protein n=1 Tax=Salmonella enteritidis (strain 2009K0958) TaxID=1192586 RepID=A0A656IDM4_SALE2|nr:hypothetical protein A673_03194 [Salmonella enterica subsp. enterica serovar Enteritidis str. 2009K0958]EPI84518.1 hypothetical protein A674_03690 [Salmonella enterica subsp. enterica serovar Enteritidis str. 2009K1651]
MAFSARVPPFLCSTSDNWLTELSVGFLTKPKKRLRCFKVLITVQ